MDLKIRDPASGENFLDPAALARQARVAQTPAEGAEARVAEFEELLRQSTRQ